MPYPKIKAYGAADAMKVDDGNDSLDTFIRQAIGKEPFFSLSRENDSPVQWIQLLHALDQQELPGWPLLSPLKIQMQKCDKCSREFCSSINYRRHIRLHRRTLNLDKDATIKNRGMLQAFWDKLCPEEAMDIISFNDVSLEGVSGSSIVKALTSFILKPGFTSLPQSYVISGSALLDIVQGRPSRFPISSQELFSILDDASEKTFLCAGTTESLQKYVFDGEAGKIGLEMRNLVACTSFLVEQKVVKACLADKDAEALRYQKLLVEEEEAAQKRQAALLEKKRLKKLRQKEQRAKEQASAGTDDSPGDSSPSPPTLSPVYTPDSILEGPEIPQSLTLSSDPVQILNVEADNDKIYEYEYSDLDNSRNVYPDLATYLDVEHRTLHGTGRRYTVNSHLQAPKSQRISYGFHTSHNYQAPKLGTMQKHASSRDFRIAATNGAKVWTPKPRSDADEESCKIRLQIEAPNPSGQDIRHEVLIGSISVTLGNCSNLQHDENLDSASECHALKLSTSDVNGIYEKPMKKEAVQAIENRSTVKLWRPVSQHDKGCQLPIRNGNSTCEVGIPCNDSNGVLKKCEAETYSNCLRENHAFVEGGLQSGSRFSSHVAEAFLAKRWKEAITSDHVRLVLFSEVRPPGCSETHDENQETVRPSRLEQRGILHSAENRLESYTNLEHSVAVKSKSRSKPEKGSKVKYIPKQRSAY